MNHHPDSSKWLPVVILLAALLLGGAAALPWWQVIDSPQPFYIIIARIVDFICCLWLLSAVLVRRFRPAALLVSAIAAIVIPVFVIQVIIMCDHAALSSAYTEDSQARWLNSVLRGDERLPYVPWTEISRTAVPAIFDNEFNVTDAIEAVASFSKQGWYTSLFTGIFLFLLVISVYRPAVHAILARYRGAMALLCIVGTLAVYGHAGLGYIEWNLARAAAAGGDYQSALNHYKRAADFDPRWNDDILFHVELGRLFGRVGRLDEQDYWEAVADAYTRNGEFYRAYQLYMDNVREPERDGATRVCYVNALVHAGVIDFNGARISLAVEKWNQAIALDPNNLQALYFRALGEAKGKNYAAAIATWKTVIEKNEQVGMYSHKLVADRNYRKIITGASWSGMAWCYYQLQDGQSAMTCRYNSMVQGPTNPEALPSPSG